MSEIAIPVVHVKCDPNTFERLYLEYFDRSGRIFGEFEPHPLRHEWNMEAGRLFFINRANLVCSIKAVERKDNSFYCVLDEDIFILGSRAEALQKKPENLELIPRLYNVGSEWHLVTIDLYRVL